MVQKTPYKTKDYSKVKFTFTDPAETVEVVGLNQNWTEALVLKARKDGSFSVEVNLPKNTRHEFRYRVNGNEWQNEAAADAEVQNPFGTTNSVLIIE